MSRTRPAFTVAREFSPALVEPRLPSDPALRGVLDDVLARLRYSLLAAAAEEPVASAGRLDRTFRQFLTSRSAPSRARYRERSQALLAAPVSLRAPLLGRYAELKLSEYRTLGSDGIAAHFGNVSVDKAAFTKSLERVRDRLAATPVLAKISEAKPQLTAAPTGAMNTLKIDADAIAGRAFKKMRLFINEVRCREETDEVGSDEINLGGTVTDPFGNTSLVGQFEVSDDFDQGEAVSYGTSKVFATWNLETRPEGFPYVYAAVLAMAEKDDGGFHDFLKELWERVDEEVRDAIAGAAGALIGGALGSAFGPGGTVVGALVGALVGFLVDWIISWFDNPDDIVGTKVLLMTLASSRKSYYDWAKLTTAGGWKTTLVFRGDGGRYAVDCSFRVFPQ